ncbi:GTP-binding protein [Streptomyces antibioticus]|uniref:GTP-binding protein n=1 Tax=Streptomyces antibioticus TaxID=1890 RepID=UPI0036DB09E3
MSGCADDSVPVALKIVVSGGLGVGKSAFVGAVSEIEPLGTEAPLTQVPVDIGPVDIGPADGAEHRATTTVALDFGRITFGPAITLYLFGTPGQSRFRFLWDDLVDGALGTVVLADPRRIEECAWAVDYVEARGAPYVLAVNRFDGAERTGPEEVRSALGLGAEVPVLECDARSADSVREVLGALMTRVIGVGGGDGPGRRPVAVR